MIFSRVRLVISVGVVICLVRVYYPNDALFLQSCVLCSPENGRCSSKILGGNAIDANDSVITKINIASCSILGRYLRRHCKFQETSSLIWERYVFVQDIINNNSNNNNNDNNNKMCHYIYTGYICKLLYSRKIFEGTMHIPKNQLSNNNNNNNNNKMCDYIYIRYVYDIMVKGGSHSFSRASTKLACWCKTLQMQIKLQVSTVLWE